jgi:hypothetical protein
MSRADTSDPEIIVVILVSHHMNEHHVLTFAHFTKLFAIFKLEALDYFPTPVWHTGFGPFPTGRWLGRIFVSAGISLLYRKNVFEQTRERTIGNVHFVNPFRLSGHPESAKMVGNMQ